MRTTILPMSDLQFKPAFWGIDRDFKDVMDSLENIWEGQSSLSDFHETEKAFVMALDMPGVNKDDLELETQGESLFIKGKRKFPFGEGEKNVQTISRTLRMPKHVDREKIHASCVDGVLYLALPKVEKAKPKKIKIADTDQKTWQNLIGADLKTKN